MTTDLSPDLILREIEKISASRAFHRAPRPKSLLRYIVNEALAEGADHLKEYSGSIERSIRRTCLHS